MNKQDQNLLNAARAVREGEPDDFSMGSYTNACGSPACVFGHYASRRDLQMVLMLNEGELLYVFPSHGVAEFADYSDPMMREHFGLTKLGSAEIFDEMGCNGAATNTSAAAYIEDFVAARQTTG